MKVFPSCGTEPNRPDPPNLGSVKTSSSSGTNRTDPLTSTHGPTMKWLSLLALAGSSEAALRFGCSSVSIQRLDPVVEPGKIPSAHLHQIVGGNGFNATMEGVIADKASCTTCTFSENFSNYWTAVMFFKHTNGSYKRVPIMQNTALPNGINGGMTIYYTQQDFNSNGNQKITAFKPVSQPTIPTRSLNKHRLTDFSPGLPHDGRQPDLHRRSRLQGQPGSALRLPAEQGHALPRAGQLPDEQVRWRHHDGAPLPQVSPTLFTPDPLFHPQPPQLPPLGSKTSS